MFFVRRLLVGCLSPSHPIKISSSIHSVVMLSSRLPYTPSFHLSRNIRFISNPTSNLASVPIPTSTDTQQCLKPLPNIRQDFAPVSKSVMNWIPPQQGLRRLHERFVNIGLVIEVRDARIPFIPIGSIIMNG